MAGGAPHGRHQRQRRGGLRVRGRRADRPARVVVVRASDLLGTCPGARSRIRVAGRIAPLNVLLVRAGALGDPSSCSQGVSAFCVLRGHSVSLRAFARGAALKDAGPCDVDSVLPWESRDFATLLTGRREASLPSCLRRRWRRSGRDRVHRVRRISCARPRGSRADRRAERHPSRRPRAACGTGWPRGRRLRVIRRHRRRPGASERRDGTARAACSSIGWSRRFLAIHPGSGAPPELAGGSVRARVSSRVGRDGLPAAARGRRTRMPPAAHAPSRGACTRPPARVLGARRSRTPALPWATIPA